MTPLRIVIFLAIILLLITTSILIIKHRGTQNSFSSSNKPVTSFYGTIDKIEGNTLIVSQPPGSSQGKMLTYKIIVTNATSVKASTLLPDMPVPKLTVRDLKIGEEIIAVSKTDLQSLNSSEFEASSINVVFQNVLNGTIVDASGNTLTLKTLKPAASNSPSIVFPPAPTYRNLQITILRSTEIVKAPKEKISFSDLKKDDRVTVYTNEDINSPAKLTALKIVVSLPVPFPIPQTSSSSATPK